MGFRCVISAFIIKIWRTTMFAIIVEHSTKITNIIYQNKTAMETKIVLISVILLLLTVAVACSTGLSTATLSEDTELNRMQYISITTNTRITATVC